MVELVPPGLILIVGALLAQAVPRVARPAAMLLLPALGLAQLWMLPEGFELSVAFMGYDLVPVRVDRLARVFATIFHIAAFITVLYAWHVDDRVQQVAGLVYAGAAIGAACAGDLIALFVCWEGTALASVFLVWARRTERAYQAGMRYLVIQVTSGVTLLAGALVVFHDTGSLAFAHMELSGIGPMLIFGAFGIKAAFPLLHSWVQDAYPQGTVTGTVWMSAFTTKLAIYALIRGFAGTEILIPIGVTMAAYHLFFAVMESDLRRVLAYSLNTQLGFMVVGVGIGTELSVNGAAAHAFACVLYLGLLFMAMGAVLHRTGTIEASELGGLYRSMPATMALCLVGAAAISAVPLSSGFISKSVIVSAAAKEHHTVAFLVLVFASAAVFLHSGLKIPYFAFFARDSGKRPAEAPWNMLVAMGIAAALCIGLGVYPAALYDILPYPMHYEPYTTTHVVTQLQLLLFAALAFAVLLRTGLFPSLTPSTNVEWEWTYRRGLPLLAGVVRRNGSYLRNLVFAGLKDGVKRAIVRIRSWHMPGTPGLGEPWPTGDTALWAAVLLGAYLVMYTFS